LLLPRTAAVSQSLIQLRGLLLRSLETFEWLNTGLAAISAVLGTYVYIGIMA